MRSLSNPYPILIRYLSNPYPVLILPLSGPRPVLIRSLSNPYPVFIQSLSDPYPNLIRSLSVKKIDQFSNPAFYTHIVVHPELTFRGKGGAKKLAHTTFLYQACQAVDETTRPPRVVSAAKKGEEGFLLAYLGLYDPRFVKGK